MEAQVAETLTQQFPGAFEEGEAQSAAGPLREEVGLIEAGRLGRTARDLQELVDRIASEGREPTDSEKKEIEKLDKRINDTFRDIVERSLERDDLSPEEESALQKCRGLIPGDS